MKFKIIFIFTLFLSALTAIAQDSGQKIKSLDQLLSQGTTSISKILSDPAYMNLHTLTPFREMIKKYSKAETITIVTPNEPGLKILVKGTIKSPDGKAVNDAMVYVYQTSDKGWYSDTAPHVLIMEGDRRHARLFGYIKTDANGNFSFNTIRPNGYPKSDLPAHIHLELTESNGSGLGTELLFEEDPRLVGHIRENAIRDKFYISKNTGSKENALYVYQITSRD